MIVLSFLKRGNAIIIQCKIPQIKALIFDLDDTLFPEREFVFSGYKAVDSYLFQKIGISIFGSLKRLFLNGNRGDLFSIALKEANVKFDESLIKEAVAIYRQHIPNISLFSDVDDCLSRFRREGFKLGLVTDGWHEVQKRKVKALKVETILDSIVYTDMIAGVSSWKPSPCGFEECLRELGVTAEQAIYLGDNPEKDFIGARNAGLKSIRVKRSGCEHTEKIPQTADFCPTAEISSLDYLLVDKDKAVLIA